MEMLVLSLYKETGKTHNYFSCAIGRKWCEVKPLGVWENVLSVLLFVLGDDVGKKAHCGPQHGCVATRAQMRWHHQ